MEQDNNDAEQQDHNNFNREQDDGDQDNNNREQDHNDREWDHDEWDDNMGGPANNNRGTAQQLRVRVRKSNQG